MKYAGEALLAGHGRLTPRGPGEGYAALCPARAAVGDDGVRFALNCISISGMTVAKAL